MSNLSSPMSSSSTVTTRYIVVKSCAAHCEANGSNKDWVGVLVHVVTGTDPAAPEPPHARTWMVLSAYGKSGGRLQGGEPGTLQTRLDATRQYNGKVNEKVKRHQYRVVPMRKEWLQAFKVPLEMAEEALPSPQKSSPRASEAPSAPRATPMVSELPYTAARVDAVSQWQLYRMGYGTTEKANGERCLLSYDGRELRAYNRTGKLVNPVPTSALPLAQLGVAFVLDGERLLGEQAGQYVLFDVLMWDGLDVRARPYQERINLLVAALYRAHLLLTQGATPTLREARANSQMAGLMLLSPEPANVEAIVAVVREDGGEGVIIRNLSAPYSQAKGILKYKFTNDLDAIVIGMKPGTNGGSLRLGLRRLSDNAVIEVGCVRSGLTSEDLRWFIDRLTSGQYPVLKVTFLPARTVGLSLVEPTTSRSWLRADKTAWQCTTDQLGHAKERLVAKAKPAAGVKLSAPSPRLEPEPTEGLASGACGSKASSACATSSEGIALSHPPEDRMHADQVPTPGRVTSPPALVPLCISIPTAQDSALLTTFHAFPRTLLVDIRPRQKAQKTHPAQSPTAGDDPQSALSREALRRRWGLRYLDLSRSLLDRNARQSWGAIELTTPEKGISTLSKLLSQHYNVVLLCESKGQKNLAQYIIDTYFKDRPDLRCPSAQAFAQEAQSRTEGKEAMLSGSR
jgi:hypothetical protein